MYRWKINMKNGDKYVVRSNKGNSIEFIKELLGNGGITVTHYPLDVESNYKYGEGFNKIYKSDTVCIISSDVSSVEYEATHN